MRYFIWIMLFLVVTLRVVLYYQTRPSYPDSTKIRITSRVTSEPIRYTNSQYFKLSGFKIYLPLYPEITYGDKVIVEGEVAVGPEGLWPGGRNFKLKKANLIKVKEGEGILYGLREKLIEIYERNLPQPHSSLIAGVTIGSKANLGSEFWESLKKTGTAHVVVASGMNVTLVAKFLIAVLILFLPRKRAIPIALVGVWSYALLSGFDAPIIRAAIMGSVTFVAQEMGKLYYAWRALILSAIGMLLVRPDWIIDLGFILSFLATASLMLFEARIRKLIKFVPQLLREGLSTSLSAQIGVAPVLFISFGQFNILSPLINAAILWTVVPMTMIGMIGGIIGLIYEPLGRLVLLLSYPLTSWFVWVVMHSG